MDERGSGKRDNAGKVPYDLIPTHLLESTARVFEAGERKYTRWNWLKGMKWSVVIGCAKRHLAAIERGEDLDPESGQPHAAHVIANMLMLVHYRTTYTEGDDRPSVAFQHELPDAGKLDPQLTGSGNGLLEYK